MNNFNSTIKRKTCKCGCSKYPTLSCFGYYFACMPEHLAKKAGTRRKVATKNRNRRIAIAHKAKAYQREVNGQEDVELFFHYCAMELAKNPYCQECGEFIPEYLYRGATAHILAKRKDYGFPSVAAHPKNKLFLCMINGCHDKTHTWSTFATMKVWLLAVEAFKEIYPFIAEEEKKHIPQILLDAL